MTYIPRSSSSIPDSAGPIPKLVRKKHTLRILNVLATVAFVASIAGAAGIYSLGAYAETKLAEAQDALARVSSADDEQRMAAIGTFDRRLTMANILFENHLAPSRALAKIEELTKNTVQLTSLTYEYDPGFEATLVFSASTDELTSVALQRLGFAASPMFTEFVMSDISNAESESDKDGSSSDGKIEATFSGLLDTLQLAYLGQTTPGNVSVETVPVESAEDVPNDSEEVIE